MSISPGVDSKVSGMQYENPPVETSVDAENDPRGQSSPKQFTQEGEGAITVLASSDSVLSAKTTGSTASWSSTGTSSTLATPIVSSLKKSVSFIWSKNGEATRPEGTRRTWWRKRHGLYPWHGEGIVDIEAGASLLLQPLSPYGSCTSSTKAPATGPAPIVFTFVFIGYRSYTYELEYVVFRKWQYMALLVSDVEEDGVRCVVLWDEVEELEVRAGDWEARVRPGWRITALCEHVDGEDEGDSDEEEEGCDDEKGADEEWWFKTWKTRVEQKKHGGRERRKTWVMLGVVVMSITVGLGTVAVLSLSEGGVMATE